MKRKTCACLAVWATAAAVLPTPAAIRPDVRTYSLSVLGDLHFDKAPQSVYHSEYVLDPQWGKCHLTEFKRNGEKEAELRRTFRALLARRNAIVLAGHIHTTELHDCVFPEGRITQFIFNSVFMRPDLADPKPKAEAPAGYDADQQRRKDAKGLALLGEYKPFLKRHFASAAAGHYQLLVSDAGVKVLFFGGATGQTTRQFVLRGE